MMSYFFERQKIYIYGTYTWHKTLYSQYMYIQLVLQQAWVNTPQNES